MNTNTRLFIAGAAALILIMGGILIYVFFFAPAVPGPGSTGGTLFPATTTAPVGYQGGGPTIQVPSTGGSTQVKDFTKDPDVATSTDGSYFYFQPPVPSSPNPSYQIFYFTQDSSFLISVLAEPIGEVRRAAAAELAARTGLSQSDLCALPVQVTIPGNLNAHYAAMNLGLPGCAGAVRFSGD